MIHYTRMGYLIRKQTFDPLKGKPETGMVAAVIIHFR